MSNITVIAMAWLGFIVHLVVGLVALRRLGTLPLVPVVNGAIALAILAYWVPRWYSYFFQGITWYASDQAFPLYALAVLGLCVATLAGPFKGPMLHGLVFSFHGLLLLAAALFFTFFKMDRLI